MREALNALPAAHLGGPELDLRLLGDHRERLVGQRVGLKNTLQWHLHDLWPELTLPGGALFSTKWSTRIGRRLGRCEQSIQVRIARAHGPWRRPGTSVRVRLRLSVCAVRGRSEVVVNETKRLAGQVFGEHTRTIRFRQRTRCQRHTFRWKLRDEFFGIGTYRVAATVWDKDFHFSRTVTRKKSTLD